jgi:hypothetical protein
LIYYELMKLSQLGIAATIVVACTAALSGLSKPAKGEAKVPERRCCVTDPQSWYADSEEHIRQRFDIYRTNGVDMVRAEIAWALAEPAEGQWRSYEICRYLKIAREYGFHIKLIMGTMMAPPAWYLQKHPDAMLTDQNGGHSLNTLSYWYPDLHQVIDEKTTKLFEILNTADVWDVVDYVIPTFGPAGEPIYPHPWTLGPAFPVVTYWGYDANAQKSFRSTMEQKYQSLEKANAAWGTDFKTWNEVVVLPPGTKPGAYWNDMLVWYRDAKRQYVTWQIENTKKYAGSHKRVLVYVPGTAFSDQDWAEAVRTGEGNEHVKLMMDSRFVIDTAVKQGCALQYTGVSDGPEVDRLRAYMDGRGYRDIEMWGENAGLYDCAKDPEMLANIIIRNRLHGLDFTKGDFVFEKDALTPNELMPKLKQAFQMITAYWAGKTHP